MLFALVLTLSALTTFAQGNNCQPMPGVQLANPRCQQATPAANAIEWTFPKPDQVSVSKDGRTYYVLADQIFAERTTIGDDKKIEAALVYFTPKQVAVFELMYLAGKLKDVDWLLAWTAIGLTVEQNGLPEFVDKGPMFNMDFFFFKIRNGRVVAAHVESDRKFVIVLPAPANVK
jgi:hypothetical protein